MTVQKNNQYSDADLAEFKTLLEKELAKAEKEFTYLETQLQESLESKDDQGEFMDESSDSNDVEMARAMVDRKEEAIIELKNALQRIEKKTYGVCIVSGQLIDKRRLLAIPTTVKALIPQKNTK